MSASTREMKHQVSQLLTDSGAVVVAHGRTDHATRSVETLRRWLPRGHIVVVVNEPTAVDSESLAALADRAMVISPSVPQGYGANLNLGVRTLPAGLDFLVLANDDVDFPGDSLPALIGHLRADHCVGAVGPIFRDVLGRTLPSVGAFPTALDAILRSADLPARAGNLVRRANERLQISRRAARAARVAPRTEAEPADWIVGAAMAVRAAAFHDVGGFDEGFFLYFEETDLCYRLWTNGWVVVTARNAAVVHVQGQSTTEAEYRTVFRQSRRRYLIKRLGFLRWTMLEVLFLFVLIATSLSGLAAALAKPKTASRRFKAMRECWNRRVFLFPVFRRPHRNPPDRSEHNVAETRKMSASSERG